MANIHSTTPTSAVQNIDRPFREIFELLPQLNAENTEHSKEEIRRALEVHAGNGAYVLLAGIQSLGVLLAAATDRDDDRLAKKDIINIGWLIHGIGDLLEGCFFMRDNMEHAANRFYPKHDS